METHRSLAATFRAAAAQPCASLDDEALQQVLQAYVDTARSAWPEFGIAATDIVRYVAARTPAGQLPDARHAGDLLLACACASGVPAAVRAFHKSHGAVIARVLSRRRASANLADDAEQTVYERLLTAPIGRSAKIEDYKGTGPLRSWVAAAAATTLMMMRRAANRRREDTLDSGTLAGAVGEASPELRYLKERYRRELERALEQAFRSLGDRERALLRLHLGERMTIDQLGVMYSVNRATAARWLAAARAEVMTRVRDDLRVRLRLSPSECRSVVALARSQLHISVLKHLS